MAAGKGKRKRSNSVEEEFDWVAYFYILLALLEYAPCR